MSALLPHMGFRFALSIVLAALGVPSYLYGQEATRPRPPADSAPVINVIYPWADQVIPPIDSTFVIGSVTPGSRLTINGQTVDVYRTGGFLGWVKVDPGDFVFRLRAANKFGVDTFDLPVKITDNRPIPPEEGTRIRDGSARPIWNRTIRPGDEVPVSFDGTVGGTARFWIFAKRDTLGPYPMTELRARSLSSFEAYRRDEIANQSPLLTGGPTPSRGRYHGIWTVPDKLDTDTLAVLFELKVSTPKPGTARAVATGLLVPVHHHPPRVVELIDSIQILRTGPRMGYFAINQPFGVRARWWGANGPWTIIQPAPGIEAWIETEKTRLLPEGTPIPEVIIPRINTVATDSSVRLEVGMSERLPFTVSVDDDLESASITLFGAVSNTDWIERDSIDDVFADIRWAQPDTRVYRIEMEFTELLWGYDTRYEDSRFVFEVYRSPLRDSSLEGLTICVDPGHSADPGSVGPTGLIEKDANLKIARTLVAQLEAMGARVIMTRTGNEDVPLAQRPGIAFNGSADIYVSVHNNAVPDGVDPRRRNGTSTYFHHPHSRALAEAVHRHTRRATGLADYGLTQANFAVIRPPQYPTVLVECAFIIIPEQEEMLDNDAFTTRTAHGIADGILEFVRERFRSERLRRP